MFFNCRFLFTTCILTSAVLIVKTSIAANLTVPLDGSYESNIFGWSNTAPIYDNVDINVSGKFKSGLTGTNVGHTKNLNTNVTGGFLKASVVALQRGGEATVTENNIINISGGQIRHGVLSTGDQVNYNGTDRRALNQINFSEGTIGNRIEGGAGAEQNNILITGGMLKDYFVGNEACELDIARSISGGSSCGTKEVGTIYAGVQDANTANKSKNALVTLKDMNNSNTFLSTFIQGDGNEGLILGSNVTDSSEMSFDGVDGDFQGGFKDFDKVSFSEKSVSNNTNVTLTGDTYNADTWDVNGILNTNGKTLSTYKNSTLALNVGNTGSLTNQFISDANILANNSGSINGIKSLDKDLTVNNSQQMTGDYEGKNVIINNETNGVIYGNTNLISSDMSLSGLNNSGNITGNLGLSGNFSINNKTDGTINNLTIENKQLELSFLNNGTMSGNNVFDNSISNIINFTNSSNVDLSGSLTLNNGTMYLKNDYNSTIKNYTVNTNTGRLNITNNGLITGENIVNADGLYADITFSNYYNGVITGKIINQGNLFNLTNSNDGVIKDLTIVSDKGEVNIFNVAKIEGNIEAGSILSIYTNNDVKAFTNNQEFRLVEAKGMTQNAIDAEIEKFTIRTDSPFANYQMIGKNNDEGYIVFNHVAPTTFADATDLATASHNATILGSQRMYELFVNRDVNQVQGLSSGDSFNTTNKLNFMPIGGYAHQGDKDGHAGYDTNYYGGMGYLEHDFNNNFKGGLGFAYMNNSNDFKDSDGSDGNIDSYRPFAYVNYELGAWRVDLAGGVAKHKVDNDRKYSFNDVRYSAKGKYDADEVSGHLNIGYKMVLDNDMIVQPMVGAYAAKLKTDSFEEKGSGPMNMHVDSEDYNSFKSMLGMKLKKDYELESGTVLTPELHVRWYHELGDTKGGVSAFFLAQEQLFNTSGIEAPKDVGDVAFRLTTKTGTNMDLFTEAYYQFGDKFYNVGGTVGLQYNF